MSRSARASIRSAAVAVGFAATLSGIGLSRFAYTPLIPALVGAGWFSSAQADYLGAANLLGYLLGALTAHRLSERISSDALIRLGLAVGVLAFACCVQPAPFAWFFVWRALAGISGGWLMVAGPARALAATAAADRARVGTRIFLGIGGGALLAAAAVPGLIGFGLSWAWATLALLALMAGLAGEWGLRRLPHETAAASAGPRSGDGSPGVPALAITLVLAAYAGDAIAFVPHTVFWVDYLERQIGLSSGAAGLQWGLFGLGALFGPLLVAPLAARLGWRYALSTGLGIKAFGVGLALLASLTWCRSLSSLIVGALVPGVVALVSGRLASMVGTSHHKRYWGYATVLFAVAQAGAGYGMTALYTLTGRYTALFVLAAAVLVVAATMAGAARSDSSE